MDLMLGLVGVAGLFLVFGLSGLGARRGRCAGGCADCPGEGRGEGVCRVGD